MYVVFSDGTSYECNTLTHAHGVATPLFWARFVPLLGMADLYFPE